MYKSIPQDSTLSPLLFNLSLSRIKEYAVKDAEFLQYADESSLPQIAIPWKRSPRWKVLWTTLQSFLARFKPFPFQIPWIFTFKKHKPIANHSLMMEQQTIPRTEQVRFLGITHKLAHMHRSSLPAFECDYSVFSFRKEFVTYRSSNCKRDCKFRNVVTISGILTALI